MDLLAISVDPPEASEALRLRLGLDIRFLSDPSGSLMDPLNIRHRDGLRASRAGGKASRDLFLPTTFLVDAGGTIRWIFRPRTFRVRASVGEILAAIDSIEGPR